MKIKSLSRCMVLVMAFFLVAMTIPGLAYAQSHGITIQKSCTGPVAICDTNADCVDNNECTSDICNPNLPKILDCLITLTHADGFGDTLTIASIADIITTGGGPQPSPNIVINSVSGNTNCVVNGPVPCNLGPSTGAGPGSVVFRSFGYNPTALDPNPLADLATATIVDNCDAQGTQNCSTTPSPVSFGASTGLVSGCSNQSVAASTPCADTDGNVCTTAGCDGAGVCSQNHVFAPTSTPCTDTDQNLCTTAGCDGAGSCNQNHVVKPCTTNECNTGVCNPATGLCVPAATSTPCGDTDGNVCTQAGCVATGELGICNQTHIFTPASTPCPDTDEFECTTAGCNGAGVCNQRHIEQCEEITCRTPGFWGTHAGTECPLNKPNCGSKNITKAVIDNCDGCLQVCGEAITNTLPNDASSAVEAICVAVAGNPKLQLARQLTAMALNCCVSELGSDCSGDSYLAALFSECNNTCQNSNSGVQSCIDRVDCFNNGGDWVNGVCQYKVCSLHQSTYCSTDTDCGINGPCIRIPDNCHDRTLPAPYNPPGPAGSSKSCNAANQQPNQCAVIPALYPNRPCGSIKVNGQTVRNQGEHCCPADSHPESCPAGPNPGCAGATCETFIPCEPPGGCISPVCATTTEGGGVCVEGLTACDSVPNCNTSADCQGGGLCIKDTCCVVSKCAPPSVWCVNIPANSASASTASSGGPTLGSCR